MIHQKLIQVYFLIKERSFINADRSNVADIRELDSDIAFPVQSGCLENSFQLWVCTYIWVCVFRMLYVKNLIEILCNMKEMLNINFSDFSRSIKIKIFNLKIFVMGYGSRKCLSIRSVSVGDLGR